MMPGRDGAEAECVGPTEETIELEMAVALDTGIGCPARGVIGDVGPDDVAFEVVAEVENVVLDSEAISDTTGIVAPMNVVGTRMMMAATTKRVTPTPTWSTPPSVSTTPATSRP